MIMRIWRGQARGANAAAYVRHFNHTVSASLSTMTGHKGAWLLRRETDGQTEFLALTLWESRKAVEAFTGPDIDKAIVEPDARAVLSGFDDFARHYEVAFTAP
jgi:heme-degrading monooxygenase HmoA